MCSVLRGSLSVARVSAPSSVGCSCRRIRARIAYNPTMLNYQADVLSVTDPVPRFSLDQHEIGELPRFYGPELVLHSEGGSGVPGGSSKRCTRREPGSDQQGQLLMHTCTKLHVTALRIGPETNPHPAGVCCRGVRQKRSHTFLLCR